MIRLIDPAMIKKIVPALKTATIPGKSNDGCLCLVYYKSYLPKTPEQILEAQPAKDQNIDLHMFFGPLDNFVVKTKTTDSFVFTILSFTRVKGDKFRYRSFNVDLGEVVEFIAFPNFPTTVKLMTFQAVEVSRSWLEKLWYRVRGLLPWNSLSSNS